MNNQAKRHRPPWRSFLGLCAALALGLLIWNVWRPAPSAVVVREKVADKQLSLASAVARVETPTVDPSFVHQIVDTHDRESWSPVIEAEIDGETEFVPNHADFELVPVSSSNVDAMPVGEFAGEILAGYQNFIRDDHSADGPDENRYPPGEENVLTTGQAELADQIDQAQIYGLAVDEGFEPEPGARVELHEVDPASHPPTEAGSWGIPDPTSESSGAEAR